MNDEQILAMLKKMDIRAGHVKKHQAVMITLYDKWSEAVKYDIELIWRDIVSHIHGIMEYIHLNTRQFPNTEKHLDQYQVLLKVAEERVKNCE